MNIVVAAGSLRAGSLNKKLALACAEILVKDHQIKPTYLDLSALNIPLYNGDLEAPSIPEGVVKAHGVIGAATHLIMSNPEYNGSMSPVPKNLIDWISRMKDNPWSRIKVLLLGASPGALGAVRGIIHTQQAFQMAGAHVWPRTFGLSKAHEKFDSSGALNADESKKVSELIGAFIKEG